MQDNPYQAPQAHISYTPNVTGGIPVPAPKGTRFLNYLIDYAATTGLGFVVGFLAALGGKADVFESMGKLEEFAFGLVLTLGYYVAFEAAFARTIGKMVTGTKVVNERGEKPSLGKVCGRTLARIIPFEAFSFLGSDSRGWHDSLPGTYVVKCR